MLDSSYHEEAKKDFLNGGSCLKFYRKYLGLSQHAFMDSVDDPISQPAYSTMELYSTLNYFECQTYSSSYTLGSINRWARSHGLSLSDIIPMFDEIMETRRKYGEHPLRQIRTLKGLDQPQLSETSGVHRCVISGIEMHMTGGLGLDNNSLEILSDAMSVPFESVRFDAKKYGVKTHFEEHMSIQGHTSGSLGVELDIDYHIVVSIVRCKSIYHLFNQLPVIKRMAEYLMLSVEDLVPDIASFHNVLLKRGYSPIYVNQILQGKSICDILKETGLSKSHLSKVINRGAFCSSDVAFKIAKCLNIKPSLILNHG
jgi:transcriptional regulator with XRE-family HTH domain